MLALELGPLLRVNGHTGNSPSTVISKFRRDKQACQKQK
jgi:hypothetical protein